MLNAETKRKIQGLRDTLVGKIPVPTDQVKQITLGLIYKFMSDIDRENTDILGGKSFFGGEYEKYSWDKIIDKSLSSYERVTLYSEGLEKMSLNPNIPELFRDIFKNAYLPFRDPATLSQFLIGINEFTYDHSEDLGDAFEFLLSVMGSQGDAGQFRTPRHIIDFIVKVVEPKKTDKILDPACGTAGFLISAYKYILENNKVKDSDKPGSALSLTEKNRLTESFIGYDISTDMVRLSLVNMYLHNFANPNIKEYDTLTSEEFWDEDFDCIIANPPFMTPKGGIKPHKRFAIRASRSEVLFVDYIAEHLLPNGKAGVIVPDGIISRSGNAYKNLRKMLIDDKYLFVVVSLPSGVFNPYAGVKTSILFMDKTFASETENILFVKINNDGFDLGAQRKPTDKNDLPEALDIISNYKNCIINNKEFNLVEEAKIYANIVQKEKIKESGDYNLIGERYREITTSPIQKYPKIEIGKVCKVGSGNSAPQGEKYYEDGIYPFIRMSDVGLAHISNNLIESRDKLNDLAIQSLKLKKWPKKTILFPKSGASILLNHRVMLGFDAFVSSHLATIIADEDKILASFLYYLLLSLDAHEIVNDNSYPSLKVSDIAKIVIPLPPLEIQKRIVEELDGFQKIIDGIGQVIRNYKPIIEIDPNWEVKEIGETCNLMTGGTPKSSIKEYYNGDIKWLVSGDIHLGEIFDCPNRISQKGLENSNAKYLPINSVLIALNGQGKTRGTVALLKTEATCNQSIVSINPRDENILNPKYLYYFLKTIYSQIRKLTGDKQRSGLNMNIIKKINLPLPNIKKQNIIVANIEEEINIIEQNKKLIKIYKQKINEKIKSVWKE